MADDTYEPFSEDDGVPEGTVRVSMEMDLAPGSLIQHGIMVIGFYDAEGNTKYGWKHAGDATLAHSLGLLEIVKVHMLGAASGG